MTEEDPSIWINEMRRIIGWGVEDPNKPTIIWYPVEPELTYVANILSVDIEIRNVEDLGTIPGSEFVYHDPNNLLFHEMGLTIVNYQQNNKLKKVKLTFLNVAFFEFTEFAMADSPTFKELESECNMRYYLKPLEGIIMSNIERDYSYSGAFCLWKCDESPLIGRLRERNMNELNYDHDEHSFARALLKLTHFEISCNQIGEFHIIGTDVQIEDLGPYSSC